MLSKRNLNLLLNISKHCKKINEKMFNLSRDYFDKDEDVMDIICFNILQIGELAKNFDADFIEKYNQVPWKQIKGMRDKVAHGYGSIDKDRVWLTAKYDIKPLLDYCLKIINENR